MTNLTRINTARMEASGFDTSIIKGEQIKGIHKGEIELMAQRGAAPVNIECWENFDEDGDPESNTELCFTIAEAEELLDCLAKVIIQAKEMNQQRERKQMKQQLMNILLERFRDGGGVSEATIKMHGSTVKRVMAMFGDNQYVTVGQREISGTRYVTGVIKTPTKPIKMLETTLFNGNNEDYMAENLGKHEGESKSQ